MQPDGFAHDIREYVRSLLNLYKLIICPMSRSDFIDQGAGQRQPLGKVTQSEVLPCQVCRSKSETSNQIYYMKKSLLIF